MLFNTSFSAPSGIVTTERPSCLKRAAFSSTNFENILTWETEADIPPGTVFDVQYKQYVKFVSVGLFSGVSDREEAKTEKLILLFLLSALWFCSEENSVKDRIIQSGR